MTTLESIKEYLQMLNPAELKKNLKEILPLQQKDFFGIIKAMEGRPVTIRLLDPPLNEFIQAATEVLETIQPAVDAHPEYEEAALLSRFTEPAGLNGLEAPGCGASGALLAAPMRAKRDGASLC